MSKIKKFKVIKMACLLGMWGVLVGLLFGIILVILSFIISSLGSFKIWQMIIGLPVGLGILMFIMALIFIPLMNIALRVVKGLDLQLEVLESVVKKSSPNSLDKKPVSQITNSSQKSVRAGGPKPISQMTTPQKPVPKTPIKQL